LIFLISILRRGLCISSATGARRRNPLSGKAVFGLGSSILGSFAYGYIRFSEGEAAKAAKKKEAEQAYVFLLGAKRPFLKEKYSDLFLTRTFFFQQLFSMSLAILKRAT
jgi:hypothetical protein